MRVAALATSSTHTQLLTIYTGAGFTNNVPYKYLCLFLFVYIKIKFRSRLRLNVRTV